MHEVTGLFWKDSVSTPSLALRILLIFGLALVAVTPGVAHAVPPERVVFAGGLGDNHGLWTVNVDGSGLRFLTELGSQGPALSSKGQELLYEGAAPGTAMGGLDVIDVDARTWQRVGGSEVDTPRFHPGSGRVVYQVWDEGIGHMPDEQYDIYSTNIDGTYTTENVDWYGSQENPAVSPDGSMLAFDSDSDAPWSLPMDWPYHAIFAGQLSGVEESFSGYHQLNDFDVVVEAYAPTFSPDGEHVAFTGRRPDEDEFHIWEANVDGTGLHQVTATSAAYEWNPQYLADGRLVYGKDEESGGNWVTNLYVSDADGSNEQTVLSGMEWIDTRISTRQLASGVTSNDFMAAEFRPQLFFDDDDQFRPLNVDAFLGESESGSARHLICDQSEGPSSCAWMTNPLSVRLNYDTDSFIDIAGTGDESNYYSPLCHTSELRDCDTGSRTSSYYHIANTVEYDYLEYWHFYRYDDAPDVIFGADTHEGDWEGVTLAVSPVVRDTFDFALFAQHGDYKAYLRDNTLCDGGGSTSCGTQEAKVGRRLHVYVGNGNHAANPTPGGGHNGEDAWGANDGESRTSIRPFPPRVAWDTGQGYWTNWPGVWGSEDALFDAAGPRSPGEQESLFDIPFTYECVDDVCPSSMHGSASSPAAECNSWFGENVVASACAAVPLARALGAGRLHQPGTMRLQIVGRSRRSASAPGVAQLIGDPLQVGDRLLVSGSGSQGATLVVRVLSGRHTYAARFERLHLGRTQSGVVSIGGGGGPRVTLRADGRVQRPAVFRKLRSLRGTHGSRGHRQPAAGLQAIAARSGNVVLRFHAETRARLVRLRRSVDGRALKRLRVGRKAHRVEVPLGRARFITVEVAGQPESRRTFPAPVRVKPTSREHGVLAGAWSSTSAGSARRITNPMLVRGAHAKVLRKRVTAGPSRAPGVYRMRRVR